MSRCHFKIRASLFCSDQNLYYWNTDFLGIAKASVIIHYSFREFFKYKLAYSVPIKSFVIEIQTFWCDWCNVSQFYNFFKYELAYSAPIKIFTNDIHTFWAISAVNVIVMFHSFRKKLILLFGVIWEFFKYDLAYSARHWNRDLIGS